MNDQLAFSDSARPLPTASAVPAALDRGHLHSPTDPAGAEYQPGTMHGPMPAPRPPHDPEAFRTWWHETARVPVPDYLGLTAGDTLTIELGNGQATGTVLRTYRFGALVSFRNGDIENDEMYVTARNQHGHWYR